MDFDGAYKEAQSLWDQTLKKELAEERENGALHARREMVRKLGRDLPISKLAAAANLSVEEVQKILHEGA